MNIMINAIVPYFINLFFTLCLSSFIFHFIRYILKEHIKEAVRLHSEVNAGRPALHHGISLFNYGDLLQRIGGVTNCREAIKYQLLTVFGDVYVSRGCR